MYFDIDESSVGLLVRNGEPSEEGIGGRRLSARWRRIGDVIAGLLFSWMAH